MITTEERLSKLRFGTALVEFDRSLKNVAWTVTIYAIVFTGLGLIIAVGNAVGWFSVGLGIALFIEAYYIRTVRSPKVVLLAGLTLGAFAFWLIGSFVVGLINNDASMGRGIIAGCFLAYGSWNMFSSFRNYKLLLEGSDPLVNDEVRQILEAMRKGKTLEEMPDTVEWTVRGIGQRGIWRMVKKDDMLLMANFGNKTFGRGGNVEKAIFFRVGELRVESEGNKWIGKNINAKLILPTEEIKIETSPAMLERLQNMVGRSGYLSSSLQTK